MLTYPYAVCPHSRAEEKRGLRPHQAGLWFEGGVRRCAVCGRAIPERAETPEDRYRAEARAELARIVGREYWRDPQTPSDSEQQRAGASPARSPPATSREGKGE